MHKKYIVLIGVVAAGLLALNYSSFFEKPSYQLEARIGVEQERLQIDKNAEPFRTRDIADIRQGERTVLVLTKAGALYAKGDNSSGELGDGKFGIGNPRLQRIKFPDGVKLRQIDITHRHAVALTTTGDVWTWGMNISGQLGNDSWADSSTPQKVFSGAKDIAAGYRFSAAVRENGELWAWGMKCDPSTPGIEDLAKQFAQDVSVGGSYYDGLTNSVAAYCLEESNLPINSKVPRKIPATVPFESVSAGYGHLLMIDTQQTAWGFGCNGWGQLGRGHARIDKGTRKISKVAFPDGVKIEQLDAGFRHSAALDTEGRVWSWGHDLHGNQLTYKSNRADKPIQVDVPKGVTKVDAGHEATGVLASNGFYAIGENESGQLTADPEYDGRIVPKFIRLGANAQDFSMGYMTQIYW